MSKLSNKHVFPYGRLLYLNLGNVNGYFLEHTNHYSKQIFIILIF